MSALRASAGRFGAENEIGFGLRFIVLGALLLIVPWVVSLAALSGPLRYLVPATAAAILVLTFLRRPAEALLGLALFVLFYDTIALRLGNPIKQVDEIAVGLMLVVAFVRAAPIWRDWVWWPREVAVVAALGFGLLSSVAAGVPITTWLPALVLVGKGIAFLYIVMWSQFRDWELRAGLLVAFAFGMAVLLLGFVELVNPRGFQQLTGLTEEPPRIGIPIVKSVFVHPALFGWFTSAVALFLFAQYLLTRRWRWLLLALLFSVGPFLSARRRAILALGGGLLAALADSARRTRPVRELVRAWTPLAAGVVLLVVVFLPGLGNLYELTVARYIPPPIVESSPQPGVTPVPGVTPAPIAPTDNPHARVALYRGSLEIARDFFPLGGGLGRFGSWMSRVDYSPLYHQYGLSGIWGLQPDNPNAANDTFWPQLLGELGVFGMLAYLGFMASLGVVIWREAANVDAPLVRLVVLGAGMLFAQAVVESLASAMYHSPPRVYLLFLAVGVVLSLAWRRKQQTKAEGVAR